MLKYLFAVSLAACRPAPVGNSLEDGGLQAGCPALLPATAWGAGVDHRGALTAPQTWEAQDSPHRVHGLVPVSAPLRIDPCSVVLFGGEAPQPSGLRLLEGGQLVAQGTPDQPILFRGLADPDGLRRFSGIEAADAVGEVISLAWATMEGGGDPDLTTNGYELALMGQRPQSVALTHVTLTDSAGGGIRLGPQARFGPQSTALTVTGTHSGGFEDDTGMPRFAPVWFEAPDAFASLPQGAWTGNEVDHLALGHFGAVSTLTVSQTWSDPGVPLYVRGGLSVRGASLTLGSGVGLRWTSGRSPAGRGFLDVGVAGSRAALVVRGTEQQPVTMEGVLPQPGSWSGVQLFEWAGESRLDHLVVRHAGLPGASSVLDCSMSGHRFGIALNFGSRPGVEPPAGIITHTTVTDLPAGGTGIVRGWATSAAPSVRFVDRSLGNSFPGVSCPESGYVLLDAPPATTGHCSTQCD